MIPSRTLQGTERAVVYLGLSSSAAFTARLTLLLSQHLHPASEHNVPLSLDGDIYKLQARPPEQDALASFKEVPSKEHSLYLYTTVQFHLLPAFRLIHEPTFLATFYAFFDSPENTTKASRLWLIQFYLVLAFGRAFLSRNRLDGNSDPPGGGFFVRAIALLPNDSELWIDPLLAVEIFGLAALYLYSVDRKESAYLFVSYTLWGGTFVSS